MNDSVPPKATGWRRIVNAAGYSLKGITSTYKSEAAFRQELLLLGAATPLAFWLGESALEKGLLIGSIILVLIVELLNSAIESLVDRVSLANHPLSGKAKDQGSAAVLLALILAVIVWLSVLFH